MARSNIATTGEMTSDVAAAAATSAAALSGSGASPRGAVIERGLSELELLLRRFGASPFGKEHFRARHLESYLNKLEQRTLDSGPSELAQAPKWWRRRRRAPALEDPVGFEALSDDLVRALCARPSAMAASTRSVTAQVLGPDDFRKQRLELGLAEHGLVVAGGVVAWDC